MPHQGVCFLAQGSVCAFGDEANLSFVRWADTEAILRWADTEAILILISQILSRLQLQKVGIRKCGANCKLPDGMQSSTSLLVLLFCLFTLLHFRLWSPPESLAIEHIRRSTHEQVIKGMRSAGHIIDAPCYGASLQRGAY